MRNGIVYSVNDNEEFVRKMANSINSLFHFNAGLLSNTTVYILTDAHNLDLSLIDNVIKYQIIHVGKDEYSDCGTTTKKRWTKHIHYRFELFRNPTLLDLDNVLYVDCDTDFNGSIEELFIEHDSPTIHLVAEAENHLRNRKRQPKYGDLMCNTYYNSGFIFLTPKLIGKDVLNSLFDKMSYLPTIYDFAFPDQDSLNAVLAQDEFIGLVKPLPKEYNFSWWTKPKCKSTEAFVEMNYKMKHYGGSTKYDKRFLNLKQ